MVLQAPVPYRLLEPLAQGPNFKGPPKHLDLIYFCNILVNSVMHLHIVTAQPQPQPQSNPNTTKKLSETR